MTLFENTWNAMSDPACGSSAFHRQGRDLYNKHLFAHLAPGHDSKILTLLEMVDVARVLERSQIILNMQSPEPPNLRVETVEDLKGFCERNDWANAFGLRSTTPVTTPVTVLPPSPLLDLVTVDTINLSLPASALRIHSNHQLRIVGRDHDQAHILWHDETGKPEMGQKATWQAPGIFIQIKPMTRGWLDGDDVGCLISLNLPGFVGNRDNSWPLNKVLAHRVVHLIQERIRSVGVDVDLYRAQVVRCDLNRNIVLSKPFSQYKDVWESMKLPRTEKIYWERTGALYRNKSQEVSFYDKIERMKLLGHNTKHLPRNLARLEWRVKRAVNVREYLGVRTLQDVLDNWNELSARFLEFEKVVFGYDMAALQAPRPRSDQRFSDPVTPQINNLMRTCEKKELELQVSFEELDCIIRTCGFEAYASIVKAIPGLDKTYVNAYLRRMEEAVVREKALTNAEFVQCYEEVHDKLQGGYCGSDWAYYWNGHSPLSIK